MSEQSADPYVALDDLIAEVAYFKAARNAWIQAAITLDLEKDALRAVIEAQKETIAELQRVLLETSR